MFYFYVFTLLIHGAFSYTPCKDGVEIVTKETKNPEDLIGNWTYVYHWDSLNKFQREFVDDRVDHILKCPEISVSPVTMDFILAKAAKCGSSGLPFSWFDAKLRLDAPLMNMKDGIIFIGPEENWLMLDCKKMVKVVMRKVSDDYVVLINPDVAHISEMIARHTPYLSQLKCIAHNVDVGKGLSGFGLCY